MFWKRKLKVFDDNIRNKIGSDSKHLSETQKVWNMNESFKHNSYRKTFKGIFFKYMKFIGPGMMVAVAYIDPGNYATDISAGASNQFSLLSIIAFCSIISVFLQTLCIKLGSVTGLDLARACREFLPTWLSIVLYLLSEIAIIATDVAEVIGGAVALNILLRIPLPVGVFITCADIFIVLLSYDPTTSSMRMVRVFEICVALLVLSVAVCLCIDLAYIPSTPIGVVLRGFLPSKQMFQNNGMYTATSLLGATVMPHSLFLGSGIVQSRLLEYDIAHGNYSMDLDNERRTIAGGMRLNKKELLQNKYLDFKPSINAIRYAMKYSIIELSVTLVTFALFINCAILIISGASLYGTEQAIDADLYTIHRLLSDTLTPVAGTIFMLALLLSGQSSGIVCTIAGQIVCEGFIKWKLTPWKRRLITRGIAIVPCFVISCGINKDALGIALNASQIVLSFVLPFITAPLIYFTSKKLLMRVESEPNRYIYTSDLSSAQDQTSKSCIDMSNNIMTTIFGIIIWILISALNFYSVVQLLKGNV